MDNDGSPELPDKTIISLDTENSNIETSSQDKLDVNSVVGSYRILHPLSEGGMGQIFLCHPLDDFSARMVLKVLKSSEKEKSKARFHREYRMLAQLSHENIVQTYDAWADDEREYFVMEYVSGMNLAQMVKAGCVFTVEYSIYMMDVISRALCYAWDMIGLVHRDIKPSNIMIDADNIIKILDLGIAKSLLHPGTVLTLDGTSLGSPGFMSPEQIVSPRTVDCKSDIFSLGATAYFCLSGGKLPFKGKNVTEIAWAMRHNKPVPLRKLNPEVPEFLDELIMATLDADPAKRPDSWRKLLVCIDRVRNGRRMIRQV